MTITRSDRNQTFDTNGNLIHEETVTVDITAETNQGIIEAAMDAALTRLQVYIDAGPLTFTNIATAQTAMRQLQTAVQQMALFEKQIIRLLRGDFNETN